MATPRRDGARTPHARASGDAARTDGLIEPHSDRTVRLRRRVELPMALRDGSVVAAGAVTFHGLGKEGEHLALLFPADLPVPVALPADRPPYVRLHSECLTGDVFGSERCDCGAQLRDTVELLARTAGILLYLRQEGRGVGLYNKLDAYSLQDAGLDTFAANRELALAEDARDYGSAAAMLDALGVSRVRLLTNNPDKAWQLARHGISVAEVVPTVVHVSRHNVAYLTAKRKHAGHFLPLPETSARADGPIA
jgi:GTP cyclohydrolase II